MGKYINSRDYKKTKIKDDKFVFKVNVNIHGRRHTEFYSMSGHDKGIAESLGLFNMSDNFVDYLDWKPIGGASSIEGGVKKVDSYTSDDKYIYAHTQEKSYSLPKYLEKSLVRKDYILFGKREK